MRERCVFVTHQLTEALVCGLEDLNGLASCKLILIGRVLMSIPIVFARPLTP